MIEWVNCLKLKLRELKILSPKENIYTKPPGMKPVLQTTRNPRDPLPLRPMNVSDIPGLELAESTENANEDEAVESAVPTDEPTTTQVESILDTLNISGDFEDETSAIPITIPIFNFSTSNTTSQNLINLLSNPLRHTASGNTFTPFEDAFNAEPDDDDEDEIPENIPPTSLHIDYVPEGDDDGQQQSLPRDNITVIKIAESEHSSQGRIKLNDPKVTKIKIEMDYEQLFNATSSIPVKNEASAPPAAEEAPSTSASNATNGIEMKEQPKVVTAPTVPKKAPATPKKTPMHEKRKLSLREKQVQQLTHEINSEIRFKLRKKDCVDAIAFVAAFSSVWIAGFKPNPLLYCLHVGDQLLAINNIVVKSPSDAQKYIKMCSGLFVEVTIRRLPLAGIFLIRREFEGQCLGIIRDGSSPAIVEIIPNSISSHIPPRPISQDEDSTWIITQINFRNLSLISHKKYDETELLLNSSGLEMSLLLQPSDFVAKIKKELKAMKNYRDYTLQ